MRTVAECFAFLIVAHGYAFALWSFLISRRVWAGLQIAAALVVFFTPVIIGPQHVILRAFALLIAIVLTFKMIDYARHQRRDESADRGLKAYAAFLVPFPALLVCLGQRKRRPGAIVLQRDALFAMGGGAIVFSSGFLFLFAIAHIPAVRSSFLLDHVLVLAIFGLATQALSRMLFGMEQLAGFETTPLIQGALSSQTVSEFWSRYNTRVHSWLYEHVFLPADGRRAPVRGVVLTYFVSALFHEAAFDIATSRLTGYQFAFFMLQAPAALISRRLHHFAGTRGTAGTILTRTFTVLWIATSSIFFFHGVNLVFPFVYAAKQWLP